MFYISLLWCLNPFLETKEILSGKNPLILKLNWKPDIKAKNLINLLKEKENNRIHTWEERVAHCRTLMESTTDPVLCQEIIKVNSSAIYNTWSLVISWKLVLLYWNQTPCIFRLTDLLNWSITWHTYHISHHPESSLSIQLVDSLTLNLKQKRI